MPLLALALILAVLAMTALLLPVAIIFRYYHGTKRRRARPWVASINTISLAGSMAIFMITAALSSRWVDGALSYSTAGLAAGGTLALAGLALTRWERDGPELYYTPSRGLVLTISLVVTVRIAYGFWRAWNAWRSTPDEASWLAAAGIGGSMAAGATVLGYYLIYWAGVRSRSMHPG